MSQRHSSLGKVRKNREDLEDLAESDLRTSKYAQALLDAADKSTLEGKDG